jgi:hypothetical protein
MHHLTHWLLLAALAFSGSALAAEPTAYKPGNTASNPSHEAARIEALIVSVEQAKGMVFIRNGEEHDALAAGAHLRMKWKRAGSRVRTAEDFIKVCATESSMSGQKYQIRFADGHVVNSADYFNGQLHRIDAASKAAAAKSSVSRPG